jgi:hypothetical protein
MNLLSKKSMIKTGIAAAAITVAAFNFSQANSVKAPSVIKISEAKAQTLYCVSAVYTCMGYTGSGYDAIWHEVTNAENQ